MQCELPRSIRPGVLVVTREFLRQLDPPDARLLGDAIDAAGVRSMKAQGLSKPITSYTQMLTCDNRLFLSVERGAVRGLIRVGDRQLFLRRKSDADYTQVRPLCVLDFYVCESLQRSGEGKLLFEHMRQHERVEAASLGYDRPSGKFLGFLRRHFGLSSFTPQSNTFVLFDEYWSSRGRGGGQGGRPPLGQRDANSRSQPEPAATHGHRCEERVRIPIAE